MVAALFVGVGGFFGAIARYVLDRRITQLTGGTLPWGTFAINISGSFVIGVLFALIVERTAVNSSLRAPLMIGFVGAYTTFSTLALESWRMIEDGAWLTAALNLGGSVLVGMGAVVVGVTVGRTI